MMNWLWGGGSPSSPTPTTAAVNPLDAMDQLQASLDALRLRQLTLRAKNEPRVAQMQNEAREEAQRGNKRRAAELLGQIKALQRPLQQLESQIQNLETTQQMMESTATTAQVADAMRQGASSMQGMMQTHSVETVEEVYDDLHDAVQDAGQLNDALSRPLLVGTVGGGYGGNGNVYDEDVEAQLAAWEQQNSSGGTLEPTMEPTYKQPAIVPQQSSSSKEDNGSPQQQQRGRTNAAEHAGD